MASVSLPEFAKSRSQLLDVFMISSDFDLAQHFSCSVKTVECGQIFIIACRQSRKKAQHNFIGQFENLLNLPITSLSRVFRLFRFSSPRSQDSRVCRLSHTTS